MNLNEGNFENKTFNTKIVGSVSDSILLRNDMLLEVQLHPIANDFVTVSLKSSKRK